MSIFTRWPYWLKGGCLAGIVGTAIFFCLPEDLSNLAYTPWWAGWFILPAFLVFAEICILFGVDFISNSDSHTHRLLLEVLWSLSVFFIFFVFGSLVGLLVGKILSRRVKRRVSRGE